MSTYTMYQTLVAAYQRIGRDTAPLGEKIDLSYALGRMTNEEYTALILSIDSAVREVSAE